MISPIGSFLTTMDGALNASVDTLLAATTSMMAVPVVVAATLFYGVQGMRLANGDAGPAYSFVPQTVRVLLVIWLSSNLGAFNVWVRDTLYIGLPNALNAAVAAAGGPTVAAVGGVTSTGAVFDQLWAQMWVVVGSAQAQAGMLDLVTNTAAELAGITGGLALMAMALIYLCARLVLAIVIIAMPLIIGCAMFDATKPIFERGIGKIVSLIFLQFAGIIVLQVVLTGDQVFMDQIIAAGRARDAAQGALPFWDLRGRAASSGAAMATTVQNLIAMVVWLCGGAFAMYALPAIAYSIGTGIAISTAPSMLGTALALRSSAQLLSGALGRLSNMTPPSMPSMPSGPNLSLSMAPKALSGPGNALPPPPPPPLIGASK